MTKLQQYFGKPINEMTAADWDKVDEIIANFRGDKVNMNKVQRFKRMEQLARELIHSDSAIGMDTQPPRQNKMYASVTVDFSALTSILSQDMDPLKELFLLCDSIMTSKRDFIRVNFMLEDVWEGTF